MKIGVDYFSLSYATGGIKRFIIEFLKRITKADKLNSYELIDIQNSASKIYKVDDFKVKNINLFSPRLFRALSTFFNNPKLDSFIEDKNLFLFLNFISYPVSKKAKKIVFIYDTSFLKFPKFTSAKNRYLLKKMVPRSIKNSEVIVTISNSVKEELVEEYNVSPQKIKVIYMGVDDKFKPVENTQIINGAKNKYGINDKYFIYVSTIEPRKNVEGIITAYESLSGNIKNNHKLLLIGGKGWLDKGIREKVENSKDKENIVLPGFVRDNDLLSLYSGATAFVYPSFYEGFGIPILEAMACGVPVITSNTSSMPEVAGDAAILVDPNNNDEIKQAMETLINNKDKRDELIKKGLARAKKFTWDKTFSELVDIINTVKSK